MSSEEAPVGLRIGERFFGLMLILIGVIVFYFAYTSISSLLSIVPYPGFFLFAGVVLILIGVLLIFARSGEE
ncbi:MAG: hypothetical protein ACQXXH_03260 [Candidatus Bathyarchaeia archaeon]|nr:hypothetical protein [Candidatus Bathyarchaeota archaeon A05DMB-4]MDH7594760.1 hypothetical protein [Candidatus Bathyarchaeota archaeon]